MKATGGWLFTLQASQVSVILSRKASLLLLTAVLKRKAMFLLRCSVKLLLKTSTVMLTRCLQNILHFTFIILRIRLLPLKAKKSTSAISELKAPSMRMRLKRDLQTAASLCLTIISDARIVNQHLSVISLLQMQMML